MLFLKNKKISLKMLLTGSLVLCGIVFAILLQTEVFRSKITLMLYNISGEMGLSVQNVYVQGRKNTRGEDVIETMGVYEGMPILSLDIVAAQQALQKLGWIETAVVEKRYPNQIFVTIKEHTPQALWQRDEQLYLINSEGGIIAKTGLTDFKYLKILVGKDANKNVAQFLRIIAQDPTLAKLVTAGVYISKRRWNIILMGKITIKLPEKKPYETWQRLSRYTREKKILTSPVKTIDLRIPKKIFIKMRPKKKGKTI